jgi:Protein of unknown function (DUF3800)
MARFVYIDETGTGGNQPYLYVVAAVVDEEQVQPLASAMRGVAQHHLGFFLPQDFEFHGSQLWHGTHHWASKTPPELIAAYQDAIGILNACEVVIAHACIDKTALHAKYNGAADANAYRLALQFLLEKIDNNLGSLKVLVADEAREQTLGAIKMVADMQLWGAGEVPSHRLVTVIDSLHFVRSQASPGVQMADLAAYVIQRRRLTPTEHHPDAEAAMARMGALVWDRTATWRQTWP